MAGPSQPLERHEGITGTTMVDCCDADVQVVEVFNIINAVFQAPLDAPLLLMLSQLRCPSCARMLTAFTVVSTLTSLDTRRLHQRIALATLQFSEGWKGKSDALQELMKDATAALQSPFWQEVPFLTEALSDTQLLAAASAHGEPCDQGMPRHKCLDALMSNRRFRDTRKCAALAVAAALLVLRLLASLADTVKYEELCPPARAVLGGAVASPLTGAAKPQAKWNPRASAQAREARGTGYSGRDGDVEDIRKARAVSQRNMRSALTDRKHACAALEAVIRAGSVRDEYMPSFQLAPLAVLMEGGLGHAIHGMLTADALDSLAASAAQSEAPFRLATAVMLTPPLQPLLLMPGGRPPLLERRQVGWGASGESVSDALATLKRSASAFDNKQDTLNEIDEDGLHINVDSMLQFVLYVQDTSARMEEVAEEASPPAQLPLYPDGLSEYRVDAGRRAELENALRRISVITAPLSRSHAYRSEANSMKITSASAKQRTREVIRSVSSLSSSLPVSWDSSIHVAVDEGRPDMLRVLILPDQATPYANGAFLFDVLFPATYPQLPPLVPHSLIDSLFVHPEGLCIDREAAAFTHHFARGKQMKFLTTGHGSVRFNPNLYNCGKVCLSLLGTWQGPSWDPATSTFLQAMVFCAKPYFNEPAYYDDEGTRHGDQASDAYNEAIRRNAAKFAILDPLQKPLAQPYGVFRDVLKLHWCAKKDVIQRQMESTGILSSIAEQVKDALEKFDETLMHAEKQEAVKPEKALVRANEVAEAADEGLASQLKSPCTDACDMDTS